MPGVWEGGGCLAFVRRAGGAWRFGGGGGGCLAFGRRAGVHGVWEEGGGDAYAVWEEGVEGAWRLKRGQGAPGVWEGGRGNCQNTSKNYMGAILAPIQQAGAFQLQVIAVNTKDMKRHKIDRLLQT